MICTHFGNHIKSYRRNWDVYWSSSSVRSKKVRSEKEVNNLATNKRAGLKHSDICSCVGVQQIHVEGGGSSGRQVVWWPCPLPVQCTAVCRARVQPILVPGSWSSRVASVFPINFPTDIKSPHADGKLAVVPLCKILVRASRIRWSNSAKKWGAPQEKMSKSVQVFAVAGQLYEEEERRRVQIPELWWWDQTACVCCREDGGNV